MQFFMESLGRRVTSKSSALVVKTYKSESEVNGFECTAIAQGNVVTFKVRGTAATNLGTNNQYAYCGTFSKLKPLISENADHIKRAVITHQYLGQLRFDVGTCQLRMGYTFNYNGNAVDVPKGTTFYLEETFVL